MGDFNIPKAITDKYSGLGDLVLSDAMAFYQTNKKFGQLDGVIGWWKKATMYEDYGGQSINLTKFWEARAAGKSIEEAALSTFTGSKMKAKGFCKVRYGLQYITENEVIINFLKNNMEITFCNTAKHNPEYQFEYAFKTMDSKSLSKLMLGTYSYSPVLNAIRERHIDLFIQRIKKDFDIIHLSMNEGQGHQKNRTGFNQLKGAFLCAFSI